MYNPYAVTYDARMTVWRFKDIQVGGYTRQELYTVAKGDPAATVLLARFRLARPIHLSRTAINCFAAWMQMYRRVTGLLSPSEQEKL